MTHRITINVLLLLMIAPLLYGCMGQSTPSNPIYYYTVEYTPQLNVHDAPLPYVLRVHRFSASPPFNTQRIIYADKGLHRNSYGYHQWIASPGELLSFLLVRDLRQSNGFQGVLTPDAAMPSTHSVHGWIEQFVEQDNTEPPQAYTRLHITLTSTLESDPSRRILYQKSYQAHSPCKDQTPGALAQAMSEAVARIHKDVVQDLHQQLSSKQPPK